MGLLIVCCADCLGTELVTSKIFAAAYRKPGTLDRYFRSGASFFVKGGIWLEIFGLESFQVGVFV